MNKKIPYICMYLLASIPTITVCANPQIYENVPQELVYLADTDETKSISKLPFIAINMAYYKVPQQNKFFPVRHIPKLLEKATEGKRVMKISTKKLELKFFLESEEDQMYSYGGDNIPTTAFIISYTQSDSDSE